MSQPAWGHVVLEKNQIDAFLIAQMAILNARLDALTEQVMILNRSLQSLSGVPESLVLD